MKLYYEGSKTIMKEDNTQLRVEYYLVEVEKVDKDLLYGIKLTEQKNQCFIAEYTEPISYSKAEVKKIVHTLWCNSVTISSLNEIVDELISN